MGHQNRLSVLLVATLAVGLAGVSEAFAAHPRGRGELGFDLGFTDLDTTLSDESGGRFGVRAGYHFTEALAFEGQLLRSHADGIQGGYVAGADDVSVGAALMNVVLSAPSSSTVVPYVLVGGGRARTVYDPGLFESGVRDSGLAWQAGVGGRFFFSPSARTALRVELSRLREETFDAWKTHYALSAGLTWRLGD